MVGISFNSISPLDPDSATITMDEGVNNQIYTVELTSEPTADVTVNIVSNNTDVTVASLVSLDFPLADWNTPQTVRVNVAHDDDGVDDSVMLTHTATGGDYTNVTAVLTIMVNDDDDPGINFDSASVDVIEDDTKDYNVSLNTEPTADVIVTIGSNNTEVTVDPQPLTFTPDNWDTVQEVEVTAAQDDDAVDDSAILTHTATGSSDYVNGADGLITAELTVAVDDNDTAGISFDPATVTVNEGNNNQAYTVVLDTEPSANVTIAIANVSTEIDYDTEVTVAPASLDFTPDNWSTPKTVTVSTGAQDDDNDNYRAIFSHTATGGNSDYISGGSVTEEIQLFQ